MIEFQWNEMKYTYNEATGEIVRYISWLDEWTRVGFWGTTSSTRWNPRFIKAVEAAIEASKNKHPIDLY